MPINFMFKILSAFAVCAATAAAIASTKTQKLVLLSYILNISLSFPYLRVHQIISLNFPKEAKNADVVNVDKNGAFVHLFEWSWSDVAQECEVFLI